MGHIVRLDSGEQFTKAIGVLNQLDGTWHSRGDESTTELWLLDSHFEALVKAGIIPANGIKAKLERYKGEEQEKEAAVRRIVHIQNRDEFVAVLRVLDKLPGTWHSRGSPESPTLLVLDSHYQALVEAGVISSNGKEGTARGKKTTGKKSKP